MTKQKNRQKTTLKNTEKKTNAHKNHEWTQKPNGPVFL